MEQKNVPASKGALNYGILLSIALIIYSLLLFVLGLDSHPWLNYLSYIIMIVGIYLATVNFRNKYQDGLISYGKAVGVGFFTVLVASVIMAVYTFIYFSYINPDVFQQAMIEAEQRMLEEGMSDMQVDQALSMMERFQKPWVSTIFAFLGNILIGLVIALITSIFIKREEPKVQE